jgi:poly(A) polymerase
MPGAFAVGPRAGGILTAMPGDDGQPTGALLDVDPLAVELGERFLEAGFRLVLVGGSVRDLVVGRVTEDADLDFATDARPEDTIRVLQGWADARYLQGVRFGTVGARKGDRRIEITTFRQEVYPDDERKPSVTFGNDLETDLSRRDFTVNAMAVEVPGRALVDPFGGVRALAARELDTPLDPHVSFGDDPLRMLRAARFAAALELTPAPRVIGAMHEMAERLDIVSAERIRDELSRTLIAPKPSVGLSLLVETGLADRFLPELPALRVEQDPVHRHKDVLHHTLAVVDGCEPVLTLRLAALLHDVGKPRTRRITPDGVTFHNHEMEGARMAAERLRALRYPGDVISDVATLVELHLRFHSYKSGWTDSALRRYVRDAGPLLDWLNLLVRADCTTQNPKKASYLAALQDEFEVRLAALAERENLRELRPALDGDEIMEHLGLSPGPLVGKAREYLLEVRLDRGPIDREDALKLLDEWAAGQDLRSGS